MLPFWPGGIDDSVAEIPPTGGGGSGPGIGLPGENYYNQAPAIKRDEPLELQQALQEDEELIIMLKAFVETIRWH